MHTGTETTLSHLEKMAAIQRLMTARARAMLSGADVHVSNARREFRRKRTQPRGSITCLWCKDGQVSANKGLHGLCAALAALSQYSEVA
jgi:hypothetical protein